MEKNVVNNFGSFDITFEKGQGSTLSDVNGKTTKIINNILFHIKYPFMFI